MMFFRRLFCLLFFCVLTYPAFSAGTDGTSFTLCPDSLELIDEVVEDAIEKGDIPGAVVSVVSGDSIVFLRAYGYSSLAPVRREMTDSTVFDLASLSKVFTALSVMQLAEDGKIDLNARVDSYLPGFEGYSKDGSRKTPVSVMNLMTHTSGLPAYVSPSSIEDIYGKTGPQQLRDYIYHCGRISASGTEFRYSCLNFVTLQYIVEKVSGMGLDEYVETSIAENLGLEHTFYRPDSSELDLVAPTEMQKNGHPLCGVVHDPIARVLNNGVSGNAGVFSDARDLSRIAVALMNSGTVDEDTLLAPETVGLMMSVPDSLDSFGRAPGLDCMSDYSSCKGSLFPEESTFCHTGYTGTSLVIDMQHKVSVIILSNRVHPYDRGSVGDLRKAVSDIVASSIVPIDISFKNPYL